MVKLDYQKDNIIQLFKNNYHTDNSHDWEDFEDECEEGSDKLESFDFHDYDEVRAIMLEVVEIVMDESIKGQTIEEAIYPIVPREKLEWAARVLRDLEEVLEASSD